MTTLSARTTGRSIEGAPASRSRTATSVGILFIVQMVTAMVGTSLIQHFVDGSTDRTAMAIGVALMTCAGLAVVGIGLLMYPVLRDVNATLAVYYPILRVTECLVSAACGVYLLARSEIVPHHLLWVYLPTGLGGMILTYLLFVSRLIPRSIAGLGLVGYALLTVGVPLDLLGFLDMGQGLGQLLLAPGGVFELVLLPIWLIAKGFSSLPPLEASSSKDLVPAG
jgi:hypothetical protein